MIYRRATLPGQQKKWRFFKSICGMSDEHAIADLIATSDTWLMSAA